MKNTGLIGWIVAAVLGAGFLGYGIYDATSGGGKKSTAPSGNVANPFTAAALAPPTNIVNDVNLIGRAKQAIQNAVGDHLPTIGAGQTAPSLLQNPQQECNPALEPNAFPEWRVNPDTLSQATSDADSIVVGAVQSVKDGQPLTAAVAGEPGGQVVVPVQDVTLKVVNPLKSAGRQGSSIVIQKLGDAQGCFRPAGDPPYQVGQQVLLMLQNGVAGRTSSHVLSPAGRYLVGGDGTLQAVQDSPIARELQGKTLTSVVSLLQSG